MILQKKLCNEGAVANVNLAPWDVNKSTFSCTIRTSLMLQGPPFQQRHSNNSLSPVWFCRNSLKHGVFVLGICHSVIGLLCRLCIWWLHGVSILTLSQTLLLIIDPLTAFLQSMTCYSMTLSLQFYIDLSKDNHTVQIHFSWCSSIRSWANVWDGTLSSIHLLFCHKQTFVMCKHFDVLLSIRLLAYDVPYLLAGGTSHIQ